MRALAGELGIKPTKTLGQNFVHDANTVRKIVTASGVGRDDTVIEVGPGLGSLTLPLLDAAGRSWLIDPCAHRGHREVDLAMMDLFGGFGPGAWEAYEEAFPLADGWQERVLAYQAVPLLVHAVLFGGGYGRQAEAALEHAVRLGG